MDPRWGPTRISAVLHGPWPLLFIRLRRADLEDLRTRVASCQAGFQCHKRDLIAVEDRFMFKGFTLQRVDVGGDVQLRVRHGGSGPNGLALSDHLVM